MAEVDVPRRIPFGFLSGRKLAEVMGKHPEVQAELAARSAAIGLVASATLAARKRGMRGGGPTGASRIRVVEGKRSDRFVQLDDSASGRHAAAWMIEGETKALLTGVRAQGAAFSYRQASLVAPSKRRVRRGKGV